MLTYKEKHMKYIIMNVEFVSRGKAAEQLGIHYNTLYKMAKNNEIDTLKIGRVTKYNVKKYLKEKKLLGYGKKRLKICYCRVSSRKQSKDLERQKDLMKKKFPSYEIISDIASGLNFERKGLKKIIDHAVNGEIEDLVITYKDRLARFGYELIEMLIKNYSGGNITILNKKEEETPHEEITKDIISIMNVYVAKINGLRKYKKMLKDEINK